MQLIAVVGDRIGVEAQVSGQRVNVAAAAPHLDVAPAAVG